MKKAEILFALAILVGTAILFYEAWTYPYRAKLMPVITMVAMTILLLIEVLRITKKEVQQCSEIKRDRTTVNVLIPMIWFGALCFGTWLLGYYVSLPLFVFVYVLMEEKDLKFAFLLSGIALAVIYVGFRWALKVPLYEGILRLSF